MIPTDLRSASLVAAATVAASTAPGILAWPLALLLSPFLVLYAALVRFGMEFGTKRALLGENGGGGAGEEGGEGKVGASVAIAADGTGNGGGGSSSRKEA